MEQLRNRLFRIFTLGTLTIGLTLSHIPALATEKTNETTDPTAKTLSEFLKTTIQLRVRSEVSNMTDYVTHRSPILLRLRPTFEWRSPQ